MSGGSYNGGSTIVDRRGFNSYDDAQPRKIDKAKPVENTISDTDKNNFRFKNRNDLLLNLVAQMIFDRNKSELPITTHPSLRTEIRQFNTPFEWAEKQENFNERFVFVKNKHLKLIDHSIGKKFEGVKNIKIPKEIIISNALREQIGSYSCLYEWAKAHSLYKERLKACSERFENKILEDLIKQKLKGVSTPKLTQKIHDTLKQKILLYAEPYKWAEEHPNFQKKRNKLRKKKK